MPAGPACGHLIEQPVVMQMDLILAVQDVVIPSTAWDNFQFLPLGTAPAHKRQLLSQHSLRQSQSHQSEALQHRRLHASDDSSTLVTIEAVLPNHRLVVCPFIAEYAYLLGARPSVCTAQAAQHRIDDVKITICMSTS